ncbi:stAR-related lipid transfer protein 5-like isoform X1 [Mytilus californianus]|uniref:stAR-related lipid transfer protein 5-like isoform X1 n=1 Tax=Mytilus californianus TaxID=6549 RepID=UPI002247CF22|nr:stAR-related lipid transfer protein 5-like isoform X1 [Mytilus californianus]
MTTEDYHDKASKVAEELQQYLNNADKYKWEVAKETKDFKISCVKSEYFSGHLYKGEAEYNVPPKTVFEYVEPLPEGPRMKWDKNMKKIEVLKWLDKDLRINRACTSSACMGLISPRDFVDLIVTKETDTYLSTNAISCECEEFPEVKKFVRGWNYPCGVVVLKYSHNPNKCKLVSLIQPDIKGMVPKNLTDAAIPGSMAEFFTNLGNSLKEDGKVIS